MTVLKAGQLALGVKLRDDARFDNFYGERNAEAARRLQDAVRQAMADSAASVPAVLVCGDQDTGKSHLLQAVCHLAEQQKQAALCLSMDEVLPFGPPVLEGLESNTVVCLDAGQAEWEEALFHLYNRVLDRQGQLVIGLSDLPTELPFALPDLISRLQHGLTIQLGINRDDDQARILVARAEQRGLVMSDEVAAFILKRAPRKLAELLAVLNKLDDNSLKAQRRLTIPFVKTVMDW